MVDRSTWGRYESRVEIGTHRLLDLFDEHGVTATFFVLGWVAERSPRLVRTIAERGHELACHSYWHRLIFDLTPEQFRDDTRLSKSLIEQAGGCAVNGYRAPTCSITNRTLWAFEELAAAGFRYDSSIFPIRHDIYGIPEAPRAPFHVSTRSGDLMEFPLTTFGWAGLPNLPVGSGGYLRMLPFAYTRLGVRRAAAEHLPLITYVHPWELDPEQPRIAGRLKSKLRHYTGLRNAGRKLGRLLGEGGFTSFRDSGLVEAPSGVRLRRDAERLAVV